MCKNSPRARESFTPTLRDGKSVHEITTDELDVQLINVMQIAPRITWARAGEVLGLSSGAVAARWARLQRQGIAWTAVQPSLTTNGVMSAFVDVWCHQERRAEIIRTLCADPRVVSLEECSQGRDLLLTVMVRGRQRLGEFLLDDLAMIPGVTGSTCRVATALYSSGSHWRVGSLDPGQQRIAQQSAPGYRPGATTDLTAEEKDLIAALCEEPRMTVADLARRSDLTAATARRRLQRVIASGTFTFRCDLAPQFAGWPLSQYLLVSIAPAEIPRSVAALADIPQVRMCLTVTGNANLMLSVHARTVAELTDIERTIGRITPSVQHVDSILEMRTHKQMGWLLHPDGRSTGQVVRPAVFCET